METGATEPKTGLTEKERVLNSGPTVVVAMSGGVDSSVAACLLHEQGYRVIGLFMRTGIALDEAACEPGRPRGCCSAVDASDARAVAGRLGVPFFALNFKDEFDRLIQAFADEYGRGRTPNPCITCNEKLKFGRLAEYAAAAGADFLATGHYARIEREGEAVRLRRGLDTSKDQSYVLFGLPRAVLARTLLPVGGLTKEQVREHARRLGLAVSDKPDSQDICFAPDGDYARIVRERCPEAFRAGRIVDSAGREVGRHEGIPHFTVGQRRGLGIALGQPVYVTRIDPASGSVTIGPREELAAAGLRASAVRWLIDPPAGPFEAQVQIRYTHRAARAIVERTGESELLVRFREPQMAVTPGQAAVVYQGDLVLGGGWIDEPLRA